MAITTLPNGNVLLQSGAFPPVRAASTGSPLNPSTGGLLVVDGVQLAVGDRVLCKDEASSIDNGLYAAQTGPWTRTTDAQATNQFFQGMTVTCGPQGALNAGQTFVCTTTDDPVVVGMSDLTFVAQAVVQTQQQMATSATSLTIGTGSKTFVTQAGKAFQVGQYLIVNETSNSANQMSGKVTAYSGTSLTVNVTSVGGSGTHADWTIAIASSPGAAGMQPPVGLGNVTGPGSATAGHIATFADSTGLLLADGGPQVGGAGTLTPVMFANAAVGYALGMLNGTIVTSETSNALTIAIKTLAGNDPSSSDPVFFLVTNSDGGWTVIKQTAALSITAPAGATLGTPNGQANRIWVAVFNNSGTAVLGVYNSLNTSGPSILCWNEAQPTNATGITSGSTSPQIWYAASTLSSVDFRIIGYVEGTQTTAGQWAATQFPKLFGPGVKKPGDTAQEVVTTQGSGTTSTTSTTFAALSGVNLSITPSSAANMIRAKVNSTLNASNGSSGAVQLSRGTTNNTNLLGVPVVGGAAAGWTNPLSIEADDLPNTTSGQSYALQGKAQSGDTLQFGTSTEFGTVGYRFVLREIQI